MKQVLLAVLLGLIVSGCDSADVQAPGKPLPGVELLGTESNQAFLPSQDSAEALHEFAGVLQIPSHPLSTRPELIEPAEIGGKQTRLFPAVNIGFVSHQGHLVPVERGILEGDGDSFWQISFEPGRTWSEASDQGYSRAAFPFVLTSNIENETYHGLAMFLFNDAEVSALSYQIVHQLRPFLVQTRFTASAVADMNLQSLDPSIDRQALIRAFEQEQSERLNWKTWDQLAASVGASTLQDFNSGIPDADTLISGLVIDDTVYLKAANTPFGPYPYPEQMRLGIWSVSKSVGGLVALMRMAQKYGDEILDYRIVDYVNIQADHDGWENVRFRDALNMATGIGTGTNEVSPNLIHVDYISSDVDEYMAWYLAPGLQDKIDFVAQSPSYPWGPGEHVRYRDRDTFILAAALDGLLREKEGEDAELWDMLLREVYHPIGAHHIQSTGTKDTDRAMVPFLGWGIYATIDDLVKITRLLENHGEYNGQQLLSRAGVREALYHTPARGLPTGAHNEFGPKTYHLSLWHEPYIDAQGNSYSTPKLLGWGGVVLQLMPNGMIGFRIGNGGAPEMENMVRIADQIRPFAEGMANEE